MKSKKLICGIDVSKDTLDVAYNDGDKIRHFKTKNDDKSHLEIVQKLGRKRTYVMEYTGLYYLKLAFNIHSEHADVRVENPLVVKRFIQMNAERRKTDKSDAEWLYKYALEREPKQWIKPSKLLLYAKASMSSLELYKRINTMLKNYLKMLELYPYLSPVVQQSISKMQAETDAEIKGLEIELQLLTDKMYPGLGERLLTIPGFGKKIVFRLLIITNGFQEIKNYRQLISYAGLSVKEVSSGTSLVTRNRICKGGNKDLRNNLYMCAMHAIRRNKACIEQYKRLKAAGKNGKAAVIAVCCKLLKQAFAIATQGTVYDPEHKSQLTIVNP